MSNISTENRGSSEWKNYEKFGLRFLILFFGIQIFPIVIKFFTTNWFSASFFDLFVFTRYIPSFFSLTGYSIWLVAAIVAVIGALIWLKVESKDTDNDSLYYWFRVVLRYRLALGVIGYGILKLFPLQFPYPSLSNLHTNYGDFQPWKIYFHTVGITQGYEAFLGFCEILAGLLLLCRKTVTFGAGIILGFMGNVVAANFAYNIGEQVYSSFLTLIAVVLFVYDVPRLYNLLALERKAIANKFQPDFSQKWLNNLRLGLRVGFGLIVIFYGIKTFGNYKTTPYKYPQTKGLDGTYGYYNVKEFKLNNNTIPYTTTDTDRWQNVVFEKWATISIKTAKAITIDSSIGDELHTEDIDRNYESAGVGDRRYFAYKTDTLQKTLILKNKNKHHREEKFVLSYTFPNDSTIILKGINEKKDSVYAVLERINRKYLLFEGRRKPLKL